MDPMQCFNELVSAFLAREWEEARTHARDLDEWLSKGGFYFYSLDLRDTQGFCRVIDRICQNHLERITTP